MAKKNNKQQQAKRERNEAKNEALRAVKKKKNIVTTVIIAAVLVAAIVFGDIGMNAYLDSGVGLRSSVAMRTDHFKVDNAMMSYLLYSTVGDTMNTYGTMFTAYYGLDTSISLKEQTYSGDMTWFDYFLNLTLQEMYTALLLCEDAYANSVTLDETDMAEIDAKIAEINSFAVAAGLLPADYIRQEYGRGVKEQDIRNALSVYHLALKRNDQLEESLVYTDEELESYYAENSSDFDVISYKCYTVPTQAIADTLIAGGSAQAFEAAYRAHLEASLDSDNEPFTEDEILYKLNNGNVSALAYDATALDNGFTEWAFDASRQAGDTYTAEENGQIKAYYLTKTAHRLEETKTVRQILLKPDTYGSMENAYAAAETVLQQFLDGEQTEEAFDALANSKRNDADTLNEDTQSLFENVRPDDMIYAFEQWCYDEARKPGDTGIIESEDGCHVVYFVGDGEIAWKADVSEILKQQAYEEILVNTEKTCGIKVYEKRMNAIPGDLLV